MKTKLLELMDFEKVNTLLEGFNKTTGFVTAILDFEGNVLSKSGWRQICTEFHRINPETSKKCTISDTELAGKLAGGEKYHIYKCLNGLVDVAVPVVINGEHIANLFSGQFFFEEPDRMFFKNQAERYGFNEKNYLEALGKVPVVSKEKVLAAMDFLLNMTQLISETIFQKLEQTEANKALEESEERFALVIDASEQGIWDWNIETNEIFFSEQWKKQIGYKNHELKNDFNTWLEHLHPEEKENCQNAVYSYLNQPVEHFMLEFRFRHKDGTYRWIHNKASSLKNNEGKVIRMFGTHTDFTESKQVEQALVHSHELMRYVIEHNQSAIAIHDKDLKYIYVSQRYLHDYNVKEKDIIGKHHYDVFPDLPQKWKDIHQKALSGVISSADNDTYAREDGTLEWTRWECRPWYESDGSIGGIIIYTEVITERKQAEEDLRKSEENLRITLRSIGDAVISTDINGLIVNMNPIAEELCGWGLDEAAGKPLTEVFKIINDITLETVPDPVKKVLEKGEVVGLANHTLLISKNGSEYQISDSAAPIKNTEGKTTGVVLVFSDISEKYAAQKKIKESEERFQLAMNASNDGLFDWNLETNDIYYAPSWKKMLGYEDHEVPNDFSVWENTTDPEDVKKSWELQQKLITKQIDQFVVEFKMKHKHGHWVDILSRAKAIFDDNGKAIRIVGTHTDVTERKQAEEALRKSEEMMVSSQAVANICSYSTNLNENELDKSTWVCSPEFYKIFGIDKTYPHTIAGWAGLIHPDHREELVAYHEYVVKNRISFSHEYKIIRFNDGAERWVQGTGELVHNEQGRPVRMHGAIQDITGRKQAEELLRHNQERFRIAQDMSPDGFTILRPVRDTSGQIIDFTWIYENPAVAEMNGTNPEEVVGKRLLELFPGHRGTPLLKAYQQVAESGDSYIFETDYSGETMTNPTSFRIVVVPMEEDIAILAQDITERKQAEIALAVSEENLSITLRSIGDGVISTDINGLIVNMNPIAEELCGWKLTNALGKPLPEVFKIINDITRDTVADPVKKVLENGEIVGLANHTILISRNGTEYQIADSAAPIKNIEGKITGVVLVFSDISEKYAAQKKIKESEERFSLVMDASEQGIWDWNIETNEVFYSEQWKNQIGYQDHELKNDFDTWVEHLHPDESEYCRNAVYSYLNQPVEHFMMEFRFRHKDGTYRWIHNKASSLKNNKGKVIRMFGTHTDITERKQAESELQKIEWLLKPKEILQESFEPVYGDITRLNTDGVILRALGEANLKNIINDFLNLLESSSAVYEKNGDYAMGIFSSGWCQFMDKTSFESCGTNDLKKALCSGNWHCHESCWNESSKKAIDTGFPVDIECSGGIHLYAVPIRTNNEIIGSINIGYGNPPQDTDKIKELALKYQVDADELKQLSREYKTRPQYIIDLAKNRLEGAAELIGLIVQRNQAEQELISAKEKAEESDRLKSAFLANMSHEIRTPMNGILGFAELMKEPNLTGEDQQKYIRIIEKSGKRMLNIINDIVDISKIESGLMKVKNSEINVNKYLDQILTFFNPEAQTKNIKLNCKVGLPKEEAFLKTDGEKFYAILINLVKNALKFTETGFVEFGYNRPNHSYLQFYVKDTGIGIPKDRQEAIFERFIQADIANKMAHQGAGLGLSISRAYIEMLGGKIWVESEEGIGSTFYFTLPCIAEQREEGTVKNVIPEMEARNMINPEVSGLKIIIAEDDETSGELILIHIRKFGKEIINVQNGREAVEACRNNPDIDLVLMDIQLPEMSGYEATRQIRQFNTDVIIIAITAFALTGDREKAIEAGCNDYIAKPIIKDKLYELLNKYFG